MTIRTALVLIVALAAVIEDIGWRRISNWTSGGALVAGLGLHLSQKGWPGLWHSFLGALIGFGVFLIFYVMGGMGGGDVKLMAGFGALLGDGRILPAALLAAAAGGIMAVIYLGARAAWRAVRPGAPQPVVSADAKDSKSSDSIPYAPALALGALLALVTEL